jgi:Family of unknown function (DUF5709)
MSESESDDLYVGGYGGNDQVDPSESLTGDNTEDPLDAGYTVPDREPRSLRYGTTADEMRRGESLDELLSEEEPDISADDPDDVEPERRAGRLVAPDEGAHEVTEETDIASDVGRAGSAASAEEAAMYIEDER